MQIVDLFLSDLEYAYQLAKEHDPSVSASEVIDKVMRMYHFERKKTKQADNDWDWAQMAGKIKALRTELGLYQKDVGKLAGVSVSTVSSAEIVPYNHKTSKETQINIYKALLKYKEAVVSK